MRLGFFSLALLLFSGCGKDDSSDDTTDTGSNTVFVDQDNDGVADNEDCDPTDPYTYPGADDIPYDGKDNDCCCETQGEEADCCGDLVDWDGDGYDAVSAGGEDCNDGNPEVYPGAKEVCYDGIDQDCAGDEDTDDCDLDGFDRYTDCNDEDPNTYPGAPEVWYDGADQNCSGPNDSDYDQDADGQDHWDYGDGTDCDDEDPEAYLGASEHWDGRDRDCDDIVDKLTDRDSDKKWSGDASLLDGLLGYGAAYLGDLHNNGSQHIAVSGYGYSILDAEGEETLGFYGATYLLDFGQSDGEMADVATGSVKPNVEEYHGFDSASLGDLDGDGLMELVVGVPGYNNYDGKAEFYSGATLQAGGSLIPDLNLSGNDLAGVDVANLGDVNNDGYDDVGIGSGQYVNASLTVFSGASLVNGSGNLNKNDALQTLTGSAIAGRTVGGFDFNQDGFSDVLMGTDWQNEGEVLILSGEDIAQGQASLNSAISLTGTSGSLVGHSNGWIDDATGDGYPEIVVSAPGEDGDKEKSGKVYVVDGDDLPNNSSTANSLALYTLLGNAKNGHMISAEHSGDFDGDGQPDLVVSHPGDFVDLGNYGVNGRTFVHWGPDIRAGGTVEAKSSDVEFTSIQADELFGYNHIIADLNQDGLDDLVILAPRGGGPEGYAATFLSRLQ